MSESVRDREARWWCYLNAFEWPPDMPGRPERVTHESTKLAFKALQHAMTDGLARWRSLVMSGRDPVTGNKKVGRDT